MLNIDDVVSKAISLCSDSGHKLLYLTKFGSHLYGTDDENSDIDMMGIMAPSLISLLMRENVSQLTYSSGDIKGKNTKDDFDITIYSIQKWLDNLRKLEIVSTDIFFSHTHKECMVFKDDIMDTLLLNKSNLIDVGDLQDMAYVHYAHRQAKKYGLKGTTVGILKRVVEWLEANYSHHIHKLKHPIIKVGDIAEDLIAHIGESHRLFIERDKRKPGTHFIIVCGKAYQTTIKLLDFYKRINENWLRYGERARLAEVNQGVDWKACSHALRAVDQMKELLHTGVITFPLQTAPHLKEIKLGKLSWNEVEKDIIRGFDELDNLETKLISYWKCNQSFVKSFILSLYKIKEI